MKIKRSLARILRQLANHMDPLVIVNSDNQIIGLAMEDIAEGQVMVAVSGALKVVSGSLKVAELSEALKSGVEK